MASSFGQIQFSVGNFEIGAVSSFALALEEPREISLWGWFPIFHADARLTYGILGDCRLGFDNVTEWRFDAIIATATQKQVVLWPTSSIEIVAISAVKPPEAMAASSQRLPVKRQRWSWDTIHLQLPWPMTKAIRNNSGK
jgi:hypothetical protein